MRSNDTPAGGVPQIAKPASAAFKAASSGNPRSSAPKMDKVPKEELVSKLKEMAGGWNEEIEALFGMPDSLFRIQEESAAYYSKDEKFGISDVMDSLRFGKLSKPLPEYGVSLFSTPGTAGFILIDMKRNIIVRGTLFSVHDATPEKDWSSVKEAFAAAVSNAEKARQAGAVAVFDGRLKAITPVQG